MTQPYIFLPTVEAVTQTHTPTTSFSRPIILPDGHILTSRFGCFKEDGRKLVTNRTYYPVVPTGADFIIRGFDIKSINNAGTIEQHIAVAYDPDTSDATSHIYYSKDGGITWTLEYTFNYLRSVFIASNNLLYAVSGDGVADVNVTVIDTENNTTAVYNLALATAEYNSTGKILGFGSGSTHMIAFHAGEKVIGFNIVTHAFVILADFTVTEINGGNNSRANGIIGEFPNLYCMQGATGDDARELYRFTSYGVTINTWEWTKIYDMPDKTICTTSLKGKTYFVTEDPADTTKKIRVLDHLSGKMSLLYNVGDVDIIDFQAGRFDNTFFLIYKSGATYYKLYYKDETKRVGSCLSYDFMNAVPSNSQIVVGDHFATVLDRMTKCLLNLYYDNPRSYKSYLSDIKGNLVITGDTKHTLLNFNHHVQVSSILLTADDTTGTFDNTQTFYVVPSGTTTFLHGTISFWIQGEGVSYDEVSQKRDDGEGITPIVGVLSFANSSGNAATSLNIYLSPAGIQIDTLTFSGPILVEYDFDMRTGGGYHGLDENYHNLRLNGIEHKINQSLIDRGHIERVKFTESGNNAASGKICEGQISFSDFSSTYYDNQDEGIVRGFLGFSGTIQDVDYDNGSNLTVQLLGIDEELFTNASDFPATWRTTKVLLETVVDGMNKVFYRNDSINPYGSFDTVRVIDYASLDYVTIYDELLDLEDGIEFRLPNGQQFVYAIDDVPDAKITSTNLTKTYKVVETTWSSKGSKIVNKLVVYGGKYSDASGNLLQTKAIVEDVPSQEMDGVFELIFVRRNARLPADVQSIAQTLWDRLGSSTDSPFKLVSATILGDKLQTGYKVDFTNTVRRVSQADRFVLSCEYNYLRKRGSYELCESILQNEDKARMQQLQSQGRGFENEFIDTSTQETPYVATDQIIYKNSIVSLQMGIISRTPLVVDNSSDYKTASGVLGKDWEIGHAITEYSNWTVSSATTNIEDKDGHLKCLKITSTTGYVRNTIGTIASGSFDIWFYKSDTSVAKIILQSVTPSDLFTLEINNTTLKIGGTEKYTYTLGTWLHIHIEFANGSNTLVFINGNKLYEGTIISSDVERITYTATGSFWIDTIGYSWLGYRSYNNFADGVVNLKAIVEDNKPRGLWYHPIIRSGMGAYDFNSSSAEIPTGEHTLDLSPYVPPDAQMVLISCQISVNVIDKRGIMKFYNANASSTWGAYFVKAQLNSNDYYSTDYNDQPVLIHIKDQELKYYRSYTAQVTIKVDGYWN